MFEPKFNSDHWKARARWFRDHWLGIMLWAVIIALFWLFLTTPSAPGYAHKFNEGDIVCMVLTGDRAQVIDTMHYDDRVKVRVAELSVVTAEGLAVSSQEYETMWIHGYEVTNCN